MWKCRPSLLVMVLLLNVSCVSLSILQFNVIVFQNSNFPKLTGDSLINYEDTFLVPVHPIAVDSNEISSENMFDPQESGLSFSVQQQNISPIVHYTFDQPNESFQFVYNLWADSLGSDTFDTTLFENGLVDPYISAGSADGASLFTRIGNHGNDFGINNETSANQSLSEIIDAEYDVSNISAGWQIQFPIQSDYDMINISFKWRFDTPDGAFDNYNDFEGNDRDLEKILDPTPDYQEVRCRITHDETNQSFWLGNPINSTNPNGTIYYRIGLNVTQDEIWHPFEYSFLVGSQPSNYTLELGAFLNSREYWNEYFDVWFDEILILGITNMTDVNPPQPVATGLARTGDISQFKFWANFSEGTWQTPIENVTVFFTLNGIPFNASLVGNTEFVVDEAGYNQTSWYYFETFNFSDVINYNYTIFDRAGNNFTTEVSIETIGDYSPPEITDVFINDTGEGYINISVETYDWGYGVDFVELNYTIDGGDEESINMIGDGLHYQIVLPINYSSLLEFGVTLTDRIEGNSDFYNGSEIVSEYPIVAENDIVKPEILDHYINASSTTEGRTIVNVSVVDNFGEISEVYVEVSYENGTPHDKYSHVSLENSENSTNFGVYILRSMVGEKALKLPFNEFYFITFVVVDKAGNENRTKAIDWIPPDILPPKLGDEIDLEYIAPGLLRVWIQASDLGSDIGIVWLERRTKDGWINYTEMDEDERIKGKYSATITTGFLGNEQIVFRINAIDSEDHGIEEINRPIRIYSTPIFFATPLGLLLTEIVVVTTIVGIFAAIKIAQRQQLKVVRRKRFDIALGRSERLAYLGEEAIFGFVAAYGQSEGVSSALMWEPRLIGHFYQYLKELIDKANNNVSFIMQTRAQDQVTFVDFYIEEIACSAITFAYPVSTLPQQWLSALTLDQVPIGGGQGILLLMLLMREKWGEIAHNFQEEIADGVLELKDMILSGEDKGSIISKAQEFRLFISGTLEVLDEIETETDEISDDIMGDFGTEFLDDSDDDSIQDEPDEEEPDD